MYLIVQIRQFYIVCFLLFRVVEIHRICEATATPDEEGANLSENLPQGSSNNKRI